MHNARGAQRLGVGPRSGQAVQPLIWIYFISGAGILQIATDLYVGEKDVSAYIRLKDTFLVLRFLGVTKDSEWSTQKFGWSFKQQFWSIQPK